MSAQYIYIWEFSVPESSRAEFEVHYSPDGSWAQLFRRHSGYVSTQLLRDRDDPQRYLTVDRWESEAAYLAFRAAAFAEYEKLDSLCAGLTSQESLIGTFREPAA